MDSCAAQLRQLSERTHPGNLLYSAYTHLTTRILQGIQADRALANRTKSENSDSA